MIKSYKELLGPVRGESGRPLFRLDELNEDDTAGISGVYGFPHGLVVVRRDGQLYVYINFCPHQGKSLDWNPGEFLNYDKTKIICEAHGAVFNIEDGICIGGPCHGEGLMPVAVEIRDGAVYAATTSDHADPSGSAQE